MAMTISHASARAAYRSRQRDIAATLARIQELVEDHAHMASHEFDNWGFVGELGFVHSRLDDVSRVLRGRT
jgi:hypothetical protein